MDVFVAGATGVLGRRVVPRLLGAGHEVTAVARTDAAADRLRDAGARPCRVDLFDPDAVAGAARGHAAIVNLATRIPPLGRAWRRGAWRENDRLRREAAANLAAAGRASAVVIQESIVMLYDDHGEDWIAEPSRVRASTATVSAAAAEAAAHAVTGEGRRGVVLRFGLFVAPEASHTRSQVGLARHGRLAMLGDPAAYLSHVHADDAADAVVAALDAPAGTYNVCEDRPARRRDHAAALGGALGREVRPLPRWAGRTELAAPLARSLRVSNARFAEATGWRPRVGEVAAAWDDLVAAVDVPAREHQHG